MDYEFETPLSFSTDLTIDNNIVIGVHYDMYSQVKAYVRNEKTEEILHLALLSNAYISHDETFYCVTYIADMLLSNRSVALYSKQTYIGS